MIDKFVVTKNGFVCIRILGGHSFYGMVPNFQLYILYSVKFETNNFYTLQSLSRCHFNIYTIHIC